MAFVFPQRAHVFVDGSKARGYYIAAAVISPQDVASARSVITGLRHKNSASVHFKNGKDAQRRAFPRGAAATGAQTLLYVVKDRPDKIARPACLEALVTDLCRNAAGRLILEQDDSLTAADRRIIAARLRAHRCRDLDYLHQKRREEPLLRAGDSVARSCRKGGDWIRQAAPLVAGSVSCKSAGLARRTIRKPVTTRRP
ncbi:hypothetical protein ACFQ36_03320 [Arthrobacter sp. GCM10027362]|uniref:hypothetical protein n=1 Tax=Arthrobacter sp. GCM10027362 TaxID=3273379 RepID=UPI0036256781